MQNESISIMADPHIKGNHATITNLQGPLSMMFNVQIHKDLKLKGQQVKTFYVDKKDLNEIIPMDASLGGPVLKISADNYNALKTKINLHIIMVLILSIIAIFQKLKH